MARLDALLDNDKALLERLRIVAVDCRTSSLEMRQMRKRAWVAAEVSCEVE